MKKGLEQKLILTSFISSLATVSALYAGMAVDKYILNYPGEAGPATKIGLVIGAGFGTVALTSVIAVFSSALYTTNFGLKNSDEGYNVRDFTNVNLKEIREHSEKLKKTYK